MAVGNFYSKGISPTAVPSGDYFDTAEENGLRIAGRVPVVYADTSAATTLKAVDGGTGTIGAAGGTGSTGVATFNGTFQSAPYVVGTANVVGAVALTGSEGIFLASRDTGSAVFVGTSGCGFHWFAYGSKY